MKTVLIIAGIIVFLVYGFVLYCCIRVGKESDEQYNKLKEGKEQEDDRSRVGEFVLHEFKGRHIPQNGLQLILDSDNF